MRRNRTSCRLPARSTSTRCGSASGEEIDASIDAQKSGSTLASLLRVFGPGGTPLALDNQEGGDPQLNFQAATAGTYYVGVSSAPNNNYNPLVSGSGTLGGTHRPVYLERDTLERRP